MKIYIVTFKSKVCRVFRNERCAISCADEWNLAGNLYPDDKAEYVVVAHSLDECTYWECGQ